jgi:hypothetical protein
LKWTGSNSPRRNIAAIRTASVFTRAADSTPRTVAERRRPTSIASHSFPFRKLDHSANKLATDSRLGRSNRFGQSFESHGVRRVREPECEERVDDGIVEHPRDPSVESADGSRAM